MRKNNYYNFSALFTYEAEFRFAQVDPLDVDNWMFFSRADDANACGFVHVL